MDGRFPGERINIVYTSRDKKDEKEKDAHEGGLGFDEMVVGW